FIEATKSNASAVLAAIDDFGFGSIGFTEEDLLNPEMVIQMGRVPLRIDLLCELPGINFTDVYKRAIEFKTEGVIMKVIHVNDLITNKETVGREKDIMDVKALRKKYKK